MAESRIEWTNATWNPVAGCQIVSAGCTNCYAMTMAKRLEAMGVDKYAGLTRKTGKRTVWNGVVREDREALSLPRGWRKPRKVFVNSMSDLFHESVSDGFIFDVWQVMRKTPRHTYQILTKRPDRMRDFVAARIGRALPNVWLGVSVEDFAASERIDVLIDTPAAIRFVSFEPLIGDVSFFDADLIDWVIVGGESGPGARPMREEWVNGIYSQCLGFGTPFFFKQWGAWGPDGKKRSKKANGRAYRGRIFNEMPTAPSMRAKWVNELVQRQKG